MALENEEEEHLRLYIEAEKKKMQIAFEKAEEHQKAINRYEEELKRRGK